MASTTPQSQLLQNRRLFPIIGVVPYAVLALLVVFTIVSRRDDPGVLAIDLGLSAVTAAWMLVLFSLRRTWRSKPRIMAVFVTGIVVLLAVLVLREPWFGVFSIAAFIYAFGLLRWPWRLVGVAAVAALSGYAQASAIPKDTALGLAATAAIILVNIVVMCGYCWVQQISDQLAAERTRALDEVRATNARLESSLTEIAALHEQLLTQARQAGVLDERQRMAREIHDTLAQGLIGIITQLEAADLAGADADTRSRHIQAASALARESLSEARRSVSALRPEPLETARLGDALADVAQRWSQRQGIPVQVTTTGAVEPVASEAEIALLRAAQEALANVAKHAGARRVGVTLSYLAGEVALDVRDDGAGFDLGTLAGRDSGRDPSSGGFGLVALRERVESLDGSVQLESEPGQGTAVSVRVPVGLPAGSVAGMSAARGASE